jgi:hypothetical protein
MADNPDFDRLGDLLPAADEAAAPSAGAARGAGGGRSAFSPQDTGSAALAADLNRRLAAVWADAVGAEVAGNARPVQLRDGRLVVTTSSSAWAQTLQLMSEMVIARLNERLGVGAVEKAVFRHAGWEDFSPSAGGKTPPGRGPRGRDGRDARAAAPSTPGPTRAAEPPAPDGRPAPLGGDLAGFSDEEKQALADLELLPLPPSAKDTIRDAMKAGFVRAKQDSGRS